MAGTRKLPWGWIQPTGPGYRHARRSERKSNWEGAYRVPAFVRWPGHFPANTTLNGIVAHEDWLPTFAAAAGDPGIKEKLLNGVDLNGRRYRNYVDGYNILDYPPPASAAPQCSPK
jgi:arylsulfatase A-like enzyme